MAEHAHEFTRFAAVKAALTDPNLAPVPPPEPRPSTCGTPGTTAWLRANVARFASGPTHARRRAVVEADLGRLDPDALRQAAQTTDGDVRLAAVRALAAALGLADPEGAARDAAEIAGIYFGGESAAADAAVARLTEAFSTLDPDADSETVANRIGLLVQACDATATLVANARSRQVAGEVLGEDVAARIASTLRHDPPVRTMRRIALRDTRVAGVDIAAGAFVTLDVAAASLDPDAAELPALTFGVEPRRCPGEKYAIALAAGIIQRLR